MTTRPITEELIENLQLALDTLEESVNKIESLSNIGTIQYDELIFDLIDTDWAIIYCNSKPVIQIWDPKTLETRERDISGYSDLGEEMRILQAEFEEEQKKG